MERLTKFITPVGKCMTSLDSMKHYMPCIVCREQAQIKTDAKGKKYTEKFRFCDTCEVKMLFNRLKEYEDAEEQGLLLRLPCKVGTPVYMVAQDCGGDTLDCRRGDCEGCSYLYSFVEENAFDTYMVDDIGKTVFLTKAEAEQALAEMKGV